MEYVKMGTDKDERIFDDEGGTVSLHAVSLYINIL